jgi:hypothetical protein
MRTHPLPDERKLSMSRLRTASGSRLRALTAAAIAVALITGPASQSRTAGISLSGAAVSAAGAPALPEDDAYWLVASDGGMFAFGGASFKGSTGTLRLRQPIIGMAPSPSGQGYWLVASSGEVFAFGDAPFKGSTGGLQLTVPIVGMAGTPTGQGYWVVGSDGAVFRFGDAPAKGSAAGLPLTKPIVGMARTPSGQGYWLVASDGGIFAFGDAAFHGSTGAIRLAQPIIGMASTPSGRGYWLVARDGGMFAFGDAVFRGSTGAMRLNQPIVGMTPTSTGHGYWLVAGDGGIFAFGDAMFSGSTGAMRLNQPIVGMARASDAQAAAPAPVTTSPPAPVAPVASTPEAPKGPITFVNAAAGPKASAGLLKLPRPSGTAPGDVMVVGIAEHEVGEATAPAGWKLARFDFMRGDIWQWVWTRVATDSEPSTYAWKVGDPAANGAILVYRGVDAANPVHASAAETEGATVSTIEGPSMNVSVSGTMLVMFAMVEGPSPNPMTAPSGFAERTERGVHPSLATFDMRFDRTGATGDRKVQVKYGGDKVGSIGTILALQPAS